MSAHELKALLDQVADNLEFVLRHTALEGPAWSALYEAWSDAHVEADEAYRAWHRSRGAPEYAAYRAAQDREDAAQDVLAAASV